MSLFGMLWLWGGGEKKQVGAAEECMIQVRNPAAAQQRPAVQGAAARPQSLRGAEAGSTHPTTPPAQHQAIYNTPGSLLFGVAGAWEVTHLSPAAAPERGAALALPAFAGG